MTEWLVAWAYMNPGWALLIGVVALIFVWYWLVKIKIHLDTPRHYHRVDPKTGKEYWIKY